MRGQTEIYAERSKLQGEIDSLNAQRKPLIQAFTMRRTEPYTEEQDAELVRLTTLLNLRNTQMKVLNWVCSAGSWSILNWETIG